MKKRKQVKKELHDNRCRKLNRKKRKHTYTLSKINSNQETVKITDYVYHQFDVPECFSIIDNTEETLLFFMDMYHHEKSEPIKTKFFINSSQVKSVSVDALLFLLASIRNTKINRKKLFSFKGNFPLDNDAFQIYVDSGFKDFFSSNMKRMPKDTEKMRIISDKRNNPDSAKYVCQFVMEKLGLNRPDVLDVQKILIELMSNVYAHAYKGDGELMEPCWYMYAEHNKENSVRIVFADTGLGITNTVRRKFTEKIFGRKDSELLESAFSTEEFRTETKKAHRGNGLPGIKDIVLNGNISNFYVLAGKGEFHIGERKEKSYEKIEHINRIIGTLYVFDFIKQEDVA